MANVTVAGLPANWKLGDPITTVTNDQNPYQSALIATASAQAEAKRNLDASQAAVAAYPDNSLYQAQLQLNQEQYAATQKAYTNAQTNFNSANTPIAEANSKGIDTGTNGDLRTTEQTQSTPAKPLNITNDDSGDAWAPTTIGTGAGTSSKSVNAINNDNNSTPTATTNQTVINTTTARLNQFINTQANQLDQYASYTYSIGWYVLSQTQYNDMVLSHRANVSTWQLLMQSGGAPTQGRSPWFPYDFYIDDLEIESLILGGGSKKPWSSTSIKFKVVEPNGITLIENLFNAVQSVYKTAQQSQTDTSNNGAAAAKSPSSNTVKNYLQAQYCLVIEFYGYDSDGNLVAPIKGAYNTASSYGKTSVIIKYYPFRLSDITFMIANRAIEYTVTAIPIPQSYASTTDRGTVPFAVNLAGQTVDQLLNGSPIGADNTTSTKSDGRKTQPVPPKDPFELNDTGFATNGGGAAFGNPNLR